MIKKSKKINRNFNNKLSYEKTQELLELLNKYQITKTIDNLDDVFHVSHFENIEVKLPNIIKTRELNDYIITIDPDSTCLKDDAISIKKVDEGYELKVYITDPTGVIPVDSLLMNRARELGMMLEKDNYMFPSNICKKMLSLEQNKTRSVRCYKVIISPNKELASFSISKEAIKVSNNLAYKEVDKIYKSKTSIKELNQTLELLEKTKEFLILDNKKSLIKNNKNIDTQKKIMNIMIYINSCVAEYFYKNNLPFIYCGHCDNLYHFDFLKEEDVLKQILSSLKNDIFYDIKPDTVLYTQVTSPMRRYVDIIANICEDKVYFSKDYDYDEFSVWLKNELFFQTKRIRELKDYQVLKEEIKCDNVRKRNIVF